MTPHSDTLPSTRKHQLLALGHNALAQAQKQYDDACAAYEKAHTFNNRHVMINTLKQLLKVKIQVKQAEICVTKNIAEKVVRI